MTAMQVDIIRIYKGELGLMIQEELSRPSPASLILEDLFERKEFRLIEGLSKKSKDFFDEFKKIEQDPNHPLAAPHVSEDPVVRPVFILWAIDVLHMP